MITSSGWTIFLTLVFWIARLFKIDNNFPLLIGIINALITLCGMLIYTKVIETLLKKQLSPSMRILFQIPYLALLLPSSIGLMETSFSLLIAGLGIYYLLLSKPLGFSLLGFAAYIRLELLILLALTSLFSILRKQFQLKHIVGCTAIGSIPLIMYDFYFFHTVIPHSIIAKSTVYSIDWVYSIVVILFRSLPAIPQYNTLITFGIGTIFLSTVLITMVTTLNVRNGFKNYWPMLFCLWSLIVVGGYILGHVLIFEWYIPLYTIPILVACFVCFISTDYPKNIIIRSLPYALFLVSAISMTMVFYASVYNRNAYYLFESGSRVRTYLSIGNILNDEYPNATLLAPEIGGLGYSFRGRILDSAGLASPSALEFHPLKIPEQRLGGHIAAIPPGYVKANKPDIIVSYDVYAQALMNDEVIHQYNMILIPAYLPDDEIYSESKAIWGNRYLRIYIRKNLPISEKLYSLRQLSP